eukprot:scaffold174947_cov33-Tisochrysis_lutea.AAC.2
MRALPYGVVAHTQKLHFPRLPHYVHHVLIGELELVCVQIAQDGSKCTRRYVRNANRLATLLALFEAAFEHLAEVNTPGDQNQAVRLEKSVAHLEGHIGARIVIK